MKPKTGYLIIAKLPKNKIEGTNQTHTRTQKTYIRNESRDITTDVSGIKSK